MAEKTPIGGFSKSECAALTSFFDRNNNDDKASLKRQKSPETTMDTGCECVLLILRVNCSYFEIFIEHILFPIPFLTGCSNLQRFLS